MDITAPAIETRLAVFRQRCAELGLSLTPQRLAVYQMLASTEAHPSAEEVYRAIKPGMPSLSLGTVYRTLELLESHGIVSRIYTNGDQARFDANLEPHHHLVCVACQKVIDYDDASLHHLPVPTVAWYAFPVLTDPRH